MDLLSQDERKVQPVVEENKEDVNPKRGRGRPRKMDKPEKIKVPGRGPGRPPKIDSPEKLANVTIESDDVYREEKCDEGVQQNGRGRGRPPKCNTEKSMGLKSSEEEKEGSTEEKERDIKLKKGRGRPPKTNREPEIIKVPGRGRGRPPKSTASNCLNMTSAANDSEDEVIPSSRSPSNSHSPSSLLLPTMNKQVSLVEEKEGEMNINPKRGRGRPPKLDKKPEIIKVPGRGRGRPPKSAKDSLNSTNLLTPTKKNVELEELEEVDEEDSQIKRNRGRPRKMDKTLEKITVSSRGRGCPPKTGKSNRNRKEICASDEVELKEIETDEDSEGGNLKRGRERPRSVGKVSRSPRKSPLNSAANNKESDDDDSSEDSSDNWDSGSETEDKEDTDWDISQQNCIQKPVKKGSRKSPRKLKRRRGRPNTVNQSPVSPQRRAVKSKEDKQDSDVEDSSEDSSDSWDSGSEAEDKEDTDWDISDENNLKFKKQKPMKKGTWSSPRDVNKPGKRKRYTSAFSSDEEEEEEDLETDTSSKTTSLSVSKKTRLDDKEGESENESTFQKPLKRGRGRPPKFHKDGDENINDEECSQDRDSENEGPSPKSLKRGRGRPPKVSRKTESGRDESMEVKERINSKEGENSKDEDSDNGGTSSKSHKRGRGRPKIQRQTDWTEREKDEKSEMEGKMNSEDGGNSKDSNSENGAHALSPKSLKRGRGRPPKVK